MTTPPRYRARALPFLAAALLMSPLARADDAPAPKCLYVEVAKLPVRYVGEGLQPAVDGTIDGAPATLLVDTGAFDTQLTMNGAARRDLNLRMTGRYVEGVGGRSRVYSTRLKDFSIGPARSTRRTELLVIGEANLTPAFDGIAGSPFLLQMDLEVDLRNKLVKMFRPHDCKDDTELNYWPEETVVLPFARSLDRSPNPHFKVSINGKELDAMIDTGAHHTILMLDAARRLGIDVKGAEVKRSGDVAGVGSERAPHWTTTVKTVQIGGETINNAEIGIIDSQGSAPADLLLGQDFLRTHRVLFAMSQEKMYFAYLGGQPFSRSVGVPDWVRAEADGGNADAQYALATAYRNGRGVPRDPALAASWLDKAAAGGEPHANLVQGRQLVMSNKSAEAIPKLRAALERLPAERFGPLWLYLARVHNGEADLAKTELQATLKKQDNDEWPEPIAQFYLGKLDAAGLLDRAAKEVKFARGRSCDANAYMARWHAAQGDRERAASLMATVRAHCGPPPPAPAPAAAP
ncbi:MULTISPECIES: retroviral-like aspartic protease family protein [unclassified Massilia]|uniref:retroviral-like aspartic protease family protein n=1 Tax=unclassified Massilia TaxID=2609279 RepID=UPI0009E9E826|nr:MULTISPECIES: retroviral-like aspartic protease family protein [unclassified Massilia]